MNNKSFLFIVSSLILGVICYIACNNLYMSIGVAILSIVTSLLLFVPMLNQFDLKNKRYHECYHFINNFIIALSIKKSIKGALETAIGSMPSTFLEMAEGIENLNDKDKINYFATYFSFYSYRLFLQILDFWEEEGGDILKMSKFLLDDIRNEEEYLTKAKSLFSKKAVEVVSLWSFCLLIAVVLRFALKDFYFQIQSQPFFIIAIGVLFLILLFSFYLLIYKGTNIKIKGMNNNEKIS